MADKDKGTDIDKLLAEVESALGGQAPRAGTPATRQPAEAARPAQGAERAPGPLRQWVAARVSTALAAAAVAAGMVFVLFTFLPFLRAPSGAAGAFLATFVTVLVRRRR